MSDNQTPGSWPQYPPPSEGPWTPPTDPTSAPAQPTYPSAPTYPPTVPYQTPSYQTPSYQTPSSQTPSYQPASYPPAGYTPGGTTPDASGGYAPGGFTAPAYGQPAYGLPVPPPRKSRTGLIVISIVAVVVLVCGGLIVGGVIIGDKSGKTTNTAGVSTTPTAGTAGSQASTPSPTPSPTPTVVKIRNGDSATLKAHLVAYPSGSHRLSVDGSSNGVYSLNQLVKEYFDNDPDSKQALQDDEFKIAVEKDWTKSSTETGVQLLQFGDTDGSRDFLEDQDSATQADSTNTSHYSLPGIPQGHGYEFKYDEKYHYRQAELIGQAGPIAIVIFFFYTEGKFNRPAELAVMKAQLAAMKK
jgi:hypothetical protein